jgi:hypothetical protein
VGASVVAHDVVGFNVSMEEPSMDEAQRTHQLLGYEVDVRRCKWIAVTSTVVDLSCQVQVSVLKHLVCVCVCVCVCARAPVCVCVCVCVCVGSLFSRESESATNIAMPIPSQMTMPYNYVSEYSVLYTQRARE